MEATDLTYSVNSTLDLTSLMTNATQEVGASAIVEGFQTVTNPVSIDAQAKQFIGLTVELAQ